MKAMILAAGLGVRLRPLTLTTPKPLIQVNGRYLIDYQLAALAQCGVTTVVINVIDRFYKAFYQALGNGQRYGLQIHYINEGAMPCGTGMGVYQALSELGTAPFLLLSGDIWTTFDVSRLITLPQGRLAHLLLVNNPVFHPEGDFILESCSTGAMEQAGEVNQASNLGSVQKLNHNQAMVYTQTVTYGCLAYLNPRLFQLYASVVSQANFSLATILQAAMKDNNVIGQLYQGPWFNVGTYEELTALKQFLQAPSGLKIPH